MSKVKKETGSEVTEFKEKYKKEAEVLVHEVFPKKIIYLQTLFQSPELDLVRLKNLNTDLNIPVPDPILFNDVEHLAKRRKTEHNGDDYVKDNRGSAVMVFPNGNVPPNSIILELVNTLKPLVRELIDHANMIKMWLAFLIPKIEDGNNFGVSIQEDTLAETRQIETEVASYLDQISRYFITRGKLVSKVAKYPHVGDYRQSVCELDEKEFISLRLICCELRNHYATLHDLILKNIEKIRKPRNANAEALY